MNCARTLFLSLAFAAVAGAQTILVEENFAYADGLVDTVGTGGAGWATTEAGWQTGNSDATVNRFEVSAGEALYIGGGVTLNTEQNRTFAAPVTTSAAEIIEVNFKLIRPESQAGRGIGIYLTNGGVNQFFIGKKINGGVGLHAGMGSGATTFVTFGTSDTSFLGEEITATLTFNGTDTSIVLSDFNETLAAHTVAGAFTFDGISLAGYNGATLTNGIDEISVVTTPAPDPWLQVEALVELTGDGSATPYSIPIFNGGATQDLGITSVVVTGFDAADVTSGPTWDSTVAPLTAGSIDFTFTPSAGGALYTLDLEITSNDASAPSPRIVTVDIEVIDPLIAVDTTSIDFGSFANNPGPQTAIVNVTNDGGGTNLNILSTPIDGTAGFSVTSAPTSIAPGATEPIEITFDPGTRPGAFSAVLTINSDDFNFTTPEIALTATTALGGTVLADYTFGTTATLDFTSSDATIGSMAGDLIETDLGARTEFGLRITNASNVSLTAVDGNAVGWSRREAPNTTLDLTVDAPTEALTFTLTPVGGSTVDFAADGWLLVDLGAYSSIGGPTAYDLALLVDDGVSPFVLGPEGGPSIPGVAEDETRLAFDIRSLGSVTTAVTFTIMPQTTANTNGVSSQAGGYIDNITLTGAEIAPPDPTLAVASPAEFIDEGLGGPFSIPILNSGAGTLNITSVATDGSGAASTISGISFDTPLAPGGGSGTIDFTFTPDAGPGLYATNLTIVSDDPASPTTVALEITVRDPEILVVDPLVSFGPLPNNPGVQTLNLTVTNDGEAAPLVISGTTLTGAPEFTVTSLPPAIAPGATGDIEITFTPGALVGRVNASMTIQSNDYDGTEPAVTLTGFVEPAGTIVTRFAFDPSVHISGDPLLDLDASSMLDWTTGELTDQATGNGALASSNQGGANRDIASGVNANYLRFSSNREGDAQTPLLPAPNNESTWTTFTVAPDAGGGAIDFAGGTAVVDTYANTSLGTNTAADWTLYYLPDGAASWTSLGTSTGASTSSGLSAPLSLTWDLTPIGNQGAPIQFLLDPTSTGGTNGNASQRGIGFDNLILAAGSVTPGTASFASWAAGFGIPNDPADDSDGDRIPAIVEYGVGLDPTVRNPNPATVSLTEVSFPKGAEAVANGDVTWTIEVSTDLGETDPWAAVAATVDDGTTISYAFPGGTSALYARLLVDFDLIPQ